MSVLIPIIRQYSGGAVTSGKGEWIVDAVPDVSFTLKQSDKLIESLHKRIHARKKTDASAIIESLKREFAEFQNCSSILKDLQTRYAQSTNLKQLDFMELKAKLSDSKASYKHSYSKVLEIWRNLPNIILDVDETKGPIEDKTSTISINIPILNVSDRIANDYGMIYFTGPSAALDLELCDHAVSFLTEKEFFEITVPYTVREDVVNRFEQIHIDEEFYTLQTKSELHKHENSIRSKVQRLRKPEDNYAYKLCGVTELALMVTHLRHRIGKNISVVKQFAIGNRYRMPYTGKPQQSRLLSFTVADVNEEQCMCSFYSHISMLHEFWHSLGFKLRQKIIEPHLLLSHEAAAIEFHACIGGQYVDVGARISISGDYISRRIMAYQSVEDNHFLYFTSGDLVDITLLLGHLQRKGNDVAN